MIEKFSIKHGGITVNKGTVFNYPLHTHSYCEMILYMPFVGGVTVNNRNIGIDSMTAIFITPFDFHRIDVQAGTESHFIKISFDETLLKTGNKPDSSLMISQISQQSFLSSAFNDAYTHRDEKNYLQMLINAMVFRIASDGEHLRQAPSTNRYKLAAEVINLINKSFPNEICLNDIADKMCVTPQYLSQAFKSEMNIGFSQYVSKMRLNYATVLLAETNESITDICFASGYGNLSHFLRCFKKEYGVSPKKYREKADN